MHLLSPTNLISKGILLAINLWLCTCSFSQSTPLPFQQVAHRTIGTAQGLPSATVYSLLEDDDGWIWVGTGAGLYRYDGVDFVPYRSASAREADVHDLQRGPNGRIYARNFRGQIFCVQSDSLQLVGDFRGLNTKFISYGFSGDTLLVAAENSVLHFDIDEQPWPVDPSHPSQVSDSFKAPTLYRVGLKGVLIRTMSSKQIQSLGQLALPTFKADSSFNLLSTLDQGDSTWVVRWSLDERTSRKDQSVAADSTLVEVASIGAGGFSQAIRLRLPSSFDKRGDLHAQRLPNGSIIIASIRGLILVESPFTTAASYTEIFSGRAVNCIHVDRKGNVWAGTQTQGLILIPELGVRQQDYPSLHAPLVDLAVTADQEELYGVTFDGSVYRLFPSIERLSSEGINSKFWQSYTGNLYLSNVQVYPEINNNFSRGLLSLRASVKDGAELPNGQLLIANNARAELRDKFGTQTLPARVYEDPVVINHRIDIRERRATGIAHDTLHERIFIAYNDSLLAYSTRSTDEAVLPLLTWTLGSDKIGGVAQTLDCQNDELFVGLAGKGLAVVNLETSQVDNYLNDVSVERIRTTPHFVWVQTSKTVYRSKLGGPKLAFEQLSTRFGLPAGKPTAFFANEDYAYAAYDQRVVRIRADQQATTSKKQAIAFAKTARAGIALNDPNEQPFRIEANRESLRFEPRITDYSQAPETVFEYRLPGTDTSWQQASGENASIFLNTLSSGNHSLEIQLAGEPATRTVFTIVSKVPFWRKPWPYIAITCLVALGAIVAIRRRAKRNQRFAERETALRESQLTALAAQMNPHFIFNALNSVQDFMMRNDRLAANEYLTKFARLIRLTLEHSRVPEISLAQELDMMRTYLDLERIRFDDEIEIELIDDESLPLSAKLPALLVQPYVENAFKHGLLHREGVRSLQVRYERKADNVLLVSVEDNGVGRKHAEMVNNRNRTGKRFATGATARRIALLNAEKPGRFSVSVEDLTREGQAIGTRVTLRIQLSDNSPMLSTSNQTHATA